MSNCYLLCLSILIFLASESVSEWVILSEYVPNEDLYLVGWNLAKNGWMTFSSIINTVFNFVSSDILNPLHLATTRLTVLVEFADLSRWTPLNFLEQYKNIKRNKKVTKDENQLTVLLIVIANPNISQELVDKDLEYVKRQFKEFKK